MTSGRLATRQASRGRSKTSFPTARAQEAKYGGRSLLSGISGSGPGRHVASHAKPGAVSNAKGKVKTAAAVTSVLAVSGGVATAYHMHQGSLRNSAEAASQDSNTGAAIAAANALAAARDGNAAANRDLQRPGLAQTSTPGTPAPTSGSSLPAADKGPTPENSSTSSLAVLAPPPPTSTSTSTTRPPLPSQSPTPVKTTPTPVKTTPKAPSSSSSSSSSGSSSNMGYDATPEQAKAIAEQIVPSSQFLCFSNIIERESSWDLHATNSSSGAYGLGQALPGYKMASMGSDWRNSALIQIKWALSYMTGRYGSPCAAWAFWQAHDWY